MRLKAIFALGVTLQLFKMDIAFTAANVSSNLIYKNVD